MSSFNGCIKFSLDIKDKNIIFLDFFTKFINSKAHKVYLAKLLLPFSKNRVQKLHFNKLTEYTYCASTLI